MNTIPTISPVLVQANKDLIYTGKVVTSCASGIVAGSLGLAPISGFVFMAVMYTIFSVLVYIFTGKKLKEYVENPLDVFTSDIMAFVMV